MEDALRARFRSKIVRPQEGLLRQGGVCISKQESRPVSLLRVDCRSGGGRRGVLRSRGRVGEVDSRGGGECDVASTTPEGSITVLLRVGLEGGRNTLGGLFVGSVGGSRDVDARLDGRVEP